MEGSFEKQVNINGLVKALGKTLKCKTHYWKSLIWFSFGLMYMFMITSGCRSPAISLCPSLNICLVSTCSVRKLSLALSSSRWRNPRLDIMSESGVLFKHSPMRLPLRLDVGGELHLCIFKHQKDVTWSWKNLGCHWAAISGLVYCCFIILLFVWTYCAIAGWWESFHAGRRLWGSSRISDKWSCPYHAHVSKMQSWVWGHHTQS